jgi:hypothetical protein
MPRFFAWVFGLCLLWGCSGSNFVEIHWDIIWACIVCNELVPLVRHSLLPFIFVSDISPRSPLNSWPVVHQISIMTSTEWVHVSLVWPSEQLVVCVWMVVCLYFHVFGWQLNISIAKWNVPVPFLQDGNVVDITLSHIHRTPHRICNILTNTNKRKPFVYLRTS